MNRLETDFAMRIADQGQAKGGGAMSTRRKPGFAQDLVDEAMALRAAAGAVDLMRKAPHPHCRYAIGALRAASRFAPATIHFQPVRGA
jgi:hypothetical protein